MADTGAPLNLTLMEIGQAAKETVFNDAIQTINDNIMAGGTTFFLAGDISPSQITSNQDDYNPTGLSTATVLRLSTDASRDLTGIQGGADGRVLLLLNIGSFPLVLKDDATSTAAYRFQLNGDLTLNAGEGLILWYDSTSSRWRQAGMLSSATSTETTTGTNAAKAVTPAGLAQSRYGTFVAQVHMGDPNGSAMTTGDGKAYWVVPFECDGMNLVSVSMAVIAQSTSGIPTVQIANVTQAADMLSTKLTVDANESHSSTAATPAVIDAANDDVAFGDILRFDMDVAGTGTKDPVVNMGFRLP